MARKKKKTEESEEVIEVAAVAELVDVAAFDQPLCHFAISHLRLVDDDLTVHYHDDKADELSMAEAEKAEESTIDVDFSEPADLAQFFCMVCMEEFEASADEPICPVCGTQGAPKVEETTVDEDAEKASDRPRRTKEPRASGNSAQRAMEALPARTDGDMIIRDLSGLTERMIAAVAALPESKTGCYEISGTGALDKAAAFLRDTDGGWLVMAHDVSTAVAKEIIGHRKAPVGKQKWNSVEVEEVRTKWSRVKVNGKQYWAKEPEIEGRFLITRK